MRLPIAAIFAMLCAAPLTAGEISNAQSMNLVVTGSIAEHCALGSVPNMDFGNLERRSLRIETHVAFDCNIPFTMVITGARGALTHTTMPSGQGPYSGALSYELGVTMPLRQPAARILSQSFASRQLLSGGKFTSNGAIATEGMTLNVELVRPAGGAGLLAGDYSETITITVSPL